MTDKKLKSEFDNYHSLTEQRFLFINDNLKSINLKLDNHLVHSFADICKEVIKLKTNQKWAFAIGFFVLGSLMGINAYLLKHLFIILT